MVAIILRERIERQVARAGGNAVELVLAISWGIGVRRRSELLECQQCLAEGAGGSAVDILAEDGKGLP